MPLSPPLLLLPCVMPPRPRRSEPLERPFIPPLAVFGRAGV
jgi:hypothetical protein